MATRFQATQLVASPLYPNAIAWSDENLIAVACGHLVTILNPALPFGPRGLITIPTCEPYPIGVVKREDLLTGCLLSTALSRDRRPCVRSISWSPIGMASNYGSLLAVCTTEGRVKLFRPPFSDFCAEWIEVIDISDKLYDFLANTNFGESNIPGSGLAHEQTTRLESTVDCANVPNSIKSNIPGSGLAHEQTTRLESTSDCANVPNSITRRECKRRHDDATNGVNKGSKGFGGHQTGKNGEQLPKVIEIKSDKRKKNILDFSSLPQITAEQYASRSAMLSSIVVAWSPILLLTSKIDGVPQNNSSHRFSILAVGGKSGQISLWRIDVPDCYSLEHSRVPSTVTLVGLMQAHNSWVTAVNWAFVRSNSNPQVLLASGSSDGSVKIWLGNYEKLDSLEYNNVPFFLLKEVISGNVVPVSVLSLVTPVQAPDKMFLAFGKGSGSFEVWECDITSCKFDKASFHNAHDYVVTGLAWAFDGCCLYSCSQGNYVHCWLFHGNTLCEVPIPSNALGSRSSTGLPDVFISCLGVAVSPGNLVLAMVRNLDVDQLDHMYGARAQKAIVEFFWIGGQQLDLLSDTCSKLGNESCLGHSANELVYWESNILWSLTTFENLDKPLVVWDIIATLLAFKQCMPEYVNHILARWLSMTYLDSQVDLSIDEVLARISDNFSTISSRQLHLLNIICRCVVLSELTVDEISSNVNREEPTGVADEHQILFIKILLRSEKELRERLVGFSFFAALAKTSPQPGHWHPIGVAQMAQWVELHYDNLGDQLKVLTSRVQKHKRRLSSSECAEEEQCSYCSARVPFDSPEVAVCQGLEGGNKDVQKHKLVRCAVSMQVCPATPLWFCKCCNRWSSKLAPETLFILSRYPPDFKSLQESLMSKPLCPFCGILLQRLQPDFLLSVSPV